MFRPPTKYSEYLQDVRKSIDYILKRVNATTVTKIVAGTNVTISPADGTGVVTINSTGGGGGGLPVGGTAGQILSKIDSVDYNAEWIDNYALWTSTLKHEVKAGQAINKGQAVYVSSADGTNMIVSKASNTTEVTSSKTMGLLAQNLAVNGKGFVITEGLLAGLDTSAANAAGDPVWLGADGNLLFGIANKPYAPLHMVSIGVVTRKNSSNGEIFVKVQNGFELDELHNVDARFPNNNDGIFYNSTTMLWEHKPVSDVYATPTLAQVTTAGNTTTNAITVGSLNSNGNVVIGGASSSGAFQSYNGYYAFSFGTSVSAYNPNNNYTRIHMGASITYTDNFSGNFLWRSAGASVFEVANASVNFWNTSSVIVTKHNASTGNFLIGTTTDAGYKLDVNGTARVQGNLTMPNFTNIVSQNNQISFETFRTIHYASAGTINNQYGFTFDDGGGSSTLTTGVTGRMSLASRFAPTSGTAQYTTFVISPTVNQTGGANGITRGIYVNPTITAAADFRAIDVAGGKIVVTSSITSASAIARGVYFNNTLVAAANNDVLVGLDINPTFTNGAFTGLTGYGLRVKASLNTVNQTDYVASFENTHPLYGNGIQIIGAGDKGSARLLLRAGNNDGTDAFRVSGSGSIFVGTGNNANRGTVIDNNSISLGGYQTISNGNSIGIVFSPYSASNAVTFRQSGNVLIGTTTDAGYKLDVNGSTRVKGVGTTDSTIAFLVQNNTGRLLLQSDDGGSTRIGGPTARLYVGVESGGATHRLVVNGSGLFSDGGIGNAGGFYIDQGGTSSASRTIWYDGSGNSKNLITGDGNNYITSGNFGIGTATPSYPFHIASSAAANVFGTVQSTNASGTAAWVAFNDQSDNVVYRVFGSGASGTQMGVPLARTASLIANLGGSGKFLIGTYSGTDVVFGAGDQERMRIVNSTGNVLVGTTTDSGYKFNVGGDINASGHVIAQTNLKSLYQSGDEGGEIFLNAPATNTTIPTGVTIDVYQNRLRIFQQGGSANGYYLDMPSGGAGVGTNLSPIGFTGTFTVPSNPVGQRNLNITNGIVISVS